ncbi:molybdate ABC transporter substrate-binding protein [Hydrogenophaga sp.]|jgi:molybdate transport system substrate-binding protein|uniref:molybdate ABC transporter substrate-binding protein n=1 Tax=Hydrogenophaga sp. TaxID=1904254 RepID=UPI0035ADFB22
MFSRHLRLFLSTAALLLASWSAQAAQATVAVAANFAEPLRALAAVLEKTTGHRLEIVVGATGRLYAQIANGAPFDLFLAADQATVAKAESEGLTVPGSRFLYATGQLVLWSARPDLVDKQGQVLRQDGWRRLAVANPRTAPYGAAAMQTLAQLGLTQALAPRLVQGESIAQTYNFAHTGNAELAFVALSQVLEGGRLKSGSMWVVPAQYHEPIRQDAVLLKRGARNEAARALVKLMQSPAGQDLIRSFGYTF